MTRYLCLIVLENASRLQKYSPRKLQKTIESILTSELTPYQWSQKSGISRTTFIYKSCGKRRQEYRRPGSDSMLGMNFYWSVIEILFFSYKQSYFIHVLGQQNEEILVKWRRTVSVRGLPLTKEGLCYSANQLLQGGHGKRSGKKMVWRFYAKTSNSWV